MFFKVLDDADKISNPQRYIERIIGHPKVTKTTLERFSKAIDEIERENPENFSDLPKHELLEAIEERRREISSGN